MCDDVSHPAPALSGPGPDDRPPAVRPVWLLMGDRLTRLR